MPNIYKATITESILEVHGKKVIFIAILGPEDYEQGVFEALVDELILQYQYDKDTIIYILVGDSVQAHLLLFKERELLVESKINHTEASENTLNSIALQSILNNPNDYMVAARTLALTQGKKWVKECSPAIQSLKMHFQKVVVLHWNDKIGEINNYQKKLAEFREQRNSNEDIHGLCEDIESLLYHIHRDRISLLSTNISENNRYAIVSEVLLPMRKFTLTQIRRYCEEQIIILIDSIRALQMEYPDRNICLTGFFPGYNSGWFTEKALVSKLLTKEENKRAFVQGVQLIKTDSFDPEFDLEEVPHHERKAMGAMFQNPSSKDKYNAFMRAVEVGASKKDNESYKLDQRSVAYRQIGYELGNCAQEEHIDIFYQFHAFICYFYKENQVDHNAANLFINYRHYKAGSDYSKHNTKQTPENATLNNISSTINSHKSSTSQAPHTVIFKPPLTPEIEDTPQYLGKIARMIGCCKNKHSNIFKLFDAFMHSLKDEHHQDRNPVNLFLKHHKYLTSNKIGPSHMQTNGISIPSKPQGESIASSAAHP